MTVQQVAKLLWELQDTARWLDTQAERIAADSTDKRMRQVMAHQFAGRAGLIRQIIAIANRDDSGDHCCSNAQLTKEVQAIDCTVPQS